MAPSHLLSSCASLLCDRACLAPALERKAPVYTADRAWTQFGLDLKIEVIR